MKNYQTVVGFEVHIELNTKTKMFCSCKNLFGDRMNTNICPICMGYPGALPAINKKAVEAGIMAALSLKCTINSMSYFDRKNYTYPDLPKGYQITQYRVPVAEEGFVWLEKQQKKIRIKRLHLEEDAGKLIHTEEGTFVDYNRAGVPLIEIVSYPDISSAAEGKEFLETLRSMMEYLGISDAKMEQGSLRCDVNVSVRSDEDFYNEKVEIKNLNSIKNVEKAIESESKRQIALLEKGEAIKPETRTWDEKSGETLFMRTKEQAQDYRYFPEPDLSTLFIEQNKIDEIKATLPEFAQERQKRFIEQYHLKEKDSIILTKTKAIADYFETVAKYTTGEEAAKWILGEVLAKTNVWEIAFFNITAEELAELIRLCTEKKINYSMAKSIFAEMYQKGKTAKEIIDAKNIVSVNSEDVISDLVKEILNDNPKSIEDYFAGKKKAMGYLVGQCMKKSNGMAEPTLVNQILLRELEKWEH